MTIHPRILATFGLLSFACIEPPNPTEPDPDLPEEHVATQGATGDGLELVEAELARCNRCGDVDGSGAIDVRDIALAGACAASYDPARCHGCDVDADGACSPADVESLRAVIFEPRRALDCSAQACALPLCGDVDASGGAPTVSDLIAVDRCIWSPSPNLCQLCDVTGDGLCTVSDLVALRYGIYGQPLDCSAQPRR